MIYQDWGRVTTRPDLVAESGRLATQLRSDVRRESCYRANPTNRHHYSYQQAVNRWFVFTLVVFCLSCSVYNEGLKQTAINLTVLGLIVCCAVTVLGAMFLVIIHTPEFFKWLSGD